MPPQAYALVATFALLSLAIGVAPPGSSGRGIPSRSCCRRWRRSGPCTSSATGSGWAFGPEIVLYGFSIAVVSDLTVAIVAGVAAAVAQRALVRVAAWRQPS